MDHLAHTPQLTMRDYMRVLFRQKAVLITTFITVMITVVIGLQLKTPVYQATVKLLISGEKQVDSPYYRDIIAGYRNVEMALTQSEIVMSNPVIERAVKATGLYQLPLDYEKKFSSPLKGWFVSLGVKMTESKLAKATTEQKQAYLYRMAVENLKLNIKVEPVRDTNLFTINVKDFSPIGSAIIANVVSRSYVIFDLEQQLAELELKYGDKHLSVTQLKDNIENMKKGLNGQPLPDVEAIGPASVKIIEQAQIPIKPVGIPKVVTLILAIFMSIFLGVMLAFAFEYMDQTFKSPQDVESFLGLPFLGSIPRGKRISEKVLIKDVKHKTSYAHFYDNLSDQLYMLLKDKKLKSIMFTSALHGEGASTIIAHLAIYLSYKANHKVLVIDANLRHPSIGKMLEVGPVPGLVDVIEGKITLEKAVQGFGQKMSVLTAGKTELNPITFLSSAAMIDIVKRAKEEYDVVLIDCADLRSFRDPVVVSSYVDGVVIVVNEGKTRRHVVKTAIAPLIEKKVSILGVILNNRTFAIPRMIYERV